MQSYLGIVDTHGAILVAADDLLVERAPVRLEDLGAVARSGDSLDRKAVFLEALVLERGGELVDGDGAVVAHDLIGDRQQKMVAVGELHEADGRGAVEREELLNQRSISIDRSTNQSISGMLPWQCALKVKANLASLYIPQLGGAIGRAGDQTLGID